MDEILTKAEKQALLRFHSPVRDSTNWLESYEVSMSARHFSAPITVENPPYGVSPLHLFKRMDSEWQGWQGSKEWSSLEGELSLCATHDRIGLAVLTVNFHPFIFDQRWKSSIDVEIELGALSALSALVISSRAFFGDYAKELPK